MESAEEKLSARKFHEARVDARQAKAKALDALREALEDLDADGAVDPGEIDPTVGSDDPTCAGGIPPEVARRLSGPSSHPRLEVRGDAVEASLSPRTTLAGKSVAELDFRDKYGVAGDRDAASLALGELRLQFLQRRLGASHHGHVGALGGEAEAVEKALAGLDRALLAAVLEGLDHLCLGFLSIDLGQGDLAEIEVLEDLVNAIQDTALAHALAQPWTLDRDRRLLVERLFFGLGLACGLGEMFSAWMQGKIGAGAVRCLSEGGQGMAFLIIAMGMMVDNAIVVVDGFMVRLQKGMDRTRAAIEAASVPAWPLLGATIVASMAFYPIYASTFIWAALLAFLFQAIPIRPVNVAGMGLLVIGMFLMGK
mgnify:CR=1 FL=1